MTARNQEGPIAWAEVDEEWYNQTKRAEAVQEQINEGYGDDVRAGIEEGEDVDTRNSTGAIVTVTAGYSFTIENCGSVDGAATKTRYFVTTERPQLVAVEQDYTDRRSC